MMKWGRKKPSSSSTSHVFPLSWLSKFKQKGSNTQHTPMIAKQKAEPNLAPPPASWRDGRFYGGGDDSYWRLSFGEDRPRGEKSIGGLQSVWYDSDDELQFPLSSSQNCTSVGTKMAGQEKIWKFNDMAAGVQKLKRELPRNVEISPEIVARNEVERGNERKEFKEPRRKAAKDQKLRKTSRRVLGEKRAELERQSDKAGEKSRVPVEKDIFELQPIRIVQTTKKDYQKATASVKSRNSNMKTIGEDGMFEAMNLEETDGIAKEKLSLEWQKLKEMKIREVMSKSEKQRKSVYVSREVPRRTKQSSKVRVYSPRIKALEDMKKAKMKMKKKAKEVEDRTAFDSFAVVKSSFDPQQDFRNSMIEMINEKGIRTAEELEELLACYLTLNADEYHDLIIKVFRKVWLDLNQECQMNTGRYS